MSDDHRTVTEIRSFGRGSKRRTIWLDGEPWRSMAAETLRELGIEAGDTLDTAAVDAEAIPVERRLARERALRLLSYKERSEAEITRRLTDDGYPEEVAEGVVASLAETGLLDDRRFAEVYARTLVRVQGFGRARAHRAMTKRGIPDDLASAALELHAPLNHEADRALSAASRLLKTGDTPERLAGRLVRRGFSTSHALAAARQTVPEPTDPADPYEA